MSHIAFFLILSMASLGAEPVADPTANWKTYADPQRGFEMKYPPEWKTRWIGDSLYVMSPAQAATRATIGVSRMPQYIPLKELVNETMKTTAAKGHFKKSDSQLGGVKAFKLEGANDLNPDGHLLQFFADRGKDRFDVTFLVGKKEVWGNYAAIFDNVLKSFIFTAPRN